ncbi:MAG: hypothetical protein LUD76_10040 [Alistipes sp.]|nr:hypothetical protein [Alistipes sp.]
MTQVVKNVDLRATFAKMKPGDRVEISLSDATELNIRSAASRFSKGRKVKLTISAPRGSDVAIVTRTL